MIKLVNILKEIKVIGNIPNFQGDTWYEFPQNAFPGNITMIYDCGGYWAGRGVIGNGFLELYPKSKIKVDLDKVKKLDGRSSVVLRKAKENIIKKYESGNYKIIK